MSRVTDWLVNARCLHGICLYFTSHYCNPVYILLICRFPNLLCLHFHVFNQRLNFHVFSRSSTRRFWRQKLSFNNIFFVRCKRNPAPKSWIVATQNFNVHFHPKAPASFRFHHIPSLFSFSFFLNPRQLLENQVYFTQEWMSLVTAYCFEMAKIYEIYNKE